MGDAYAMVWWGRSLHPGEGSLEHTVVPHPGVLGSHLYSSSLLMVHTCHLEEEGSFLESGIGWVQAQSMLEEPRANAKVRTVRGWQINVPASSWLGR